MAALTEMKSLEAAIVAGGSGVASYQADYDALRTEIGNIVTAATFDGTAALTTPTGGTPPATVAAADGRLRAVFDEPQLSITPGQVAVFYAGDVVLASGTIEKPA